MFCDSENLPSLIDPPQSQFKSRYMWGKLEVSISRFDYTHTHKQIPEEEAVQNCHV